MADSARLPPGRLGRASQRLGPGAEPAQSEGPVVSARRVRPVTGCTPVNLAAGRSVLGRRRAPGPRRTGTLPFRSTGLRLARSRQCGRAEDRSAHQRVLVQAHQKSTPARPRRRRLDRRCRRPRGVGCRGLVSGCSSRISRGRLVALPPPHSRVSRFDDPMCIAVPGAGQYLVVRALRSRSWRAPRAWSKAQRAGQRRRVHDGQVLRRAGQGHV